jgi:CysZ protein
MAKFFKQLFQGFASYITAGKLIVEHKLYWFFIAPAVIWLGIYFLGNWFDELSAAVKVTGDNMHDIMVSLLKKEFYKGLSYMFTETTKYFVIILLSPLLAILSERVELILVNREYKFNIGYFINDIKRGIRMALWCMFQEYLLFFIYLIFALIFGFPDIMNTLVALGIGFYFYGFGFIDYINERRRLNITQSVEFLRRNAGLAFGIGIIYSLIFSYVPMDLGAIFIPIFAIVAATVLMHETVDLSKNEHSMERQK